jgi:hypothetical protein
MKTLRVLRGLTGTECGFAESVRPYRERPPIAHLFNNLQEKQNAIPAITTALLAGGRVAFGFLGGGR